MLQPGNLEHRGHYFIKLVNEDGKVVNVLLYSDRLFMHREDVEKETGFLIRDMKDFTEMKYDLMKLLDTGISATISHSTQEELEDHENKHRKNSKVLNKSTE